MSRRALPAILCLVLLSCGQRPGVHTRFAPRFRQTVAQSDTAHGASAKTRTAKPRTHVVTRIERVPAGRQILDVPSPSPGPDGSLSVSWPQWGAMLLDRLGAPRCANNLIVVVAWAAQEGTDAGWNPLATTLDLPGATSFNSVGVRNYVSLDQGLEATILTLEKGLETHGYGAIEDDLRGCAEPLVTATAINASDWCRGCAGGAYVTGVVPRVIADYVASLGGDAAG
ncbi:MAG: hypothetical protein ABR600_11320 [Actinomycetota bacterium]